jgi:hypothetical protein
MKTTAHPLVASSRQRSKICGAISTQAKRTLNSYGKKKFLWFSSNSLCLQTKPIFSLCYNFGKPFPCRITLPYPSIELPQTEVIKRWIFMLHSSFKLLKFESFPQSWHLRNIFACWFFFHLPFHGFFIAQWTSKCELHWWHNPIWARFCRFKSSC